MQTRTKGTGMCKRLLALMLTLCMVFGMFPTVIHAEEVQPANLLADGDFENGKGEWTKGAAAADPDDADNGVLKNNLMASKQLKLRPGEYYQLSFSYKNAEAPYSNVRVVDYDANGNALSVPYSLNARLYDNNGTGGWTVQNVKPATWTDFEFYFKANLGGSADYAYSVMEIQGTQTNNAYLDNVELYHCGTSTELATNGGFESVTEDADFSEGVPAQMADALTALGITTHDTFNFWGFYGASTKDTGYVGSNSVKYASASGFSLASPNYKAIPVEAGKTYVISFWLNGVAQSGSNTSSRAHFFADAYNGTEKVATEAIRETNLHSGHPTWATNMGALTSWQRYEIRYTAPQGVDSIQYRIQLGAENAGSTGLMYPVWLDEVSVVEKNAPISNVEHVCSPGEAVKENETETSYDSVVYCSVCGEELSRETITLSKVIDFGYCGGEGDGTNLTWTLSDDGTLIITGSGAMADYTLGGGGNRAPWYDNADFIETIIIGNSVTTIGEYAFSWCSSLTLVTIGDGVMFVGDSAFSNCFSLAKVIIPDSVTTISDGVFYGCDSLTSVTIPDSVTTIGDEVFHECSSLISVTIPDSVTTIGDLVFCNCSSLSSVTIPDSVTTIGKYAFYNCSSLSSVTIPDSVTTIGDSAFSSCDSLTTVTIPDSVVTIGDSAFSYCDSLTTVTIPDSVVTIGDSAFSSCDSLTTVTIPDSVVTIGDSAFYLCDSLTTVTIPDSVVTIGDSAFSSCDSLTTVTIPDSVTTIGDDAFGGCDKLVAFDVDEKNAYFSDIDGVLFNKSKTILVRYPVGRSDMSYVVPDSVTTIGDQAFSFSNLISVIFPGSVTKIGSEAFDCCLRLEAYFEGNAPAVTAANEYYSTFYRYITLYYTPGTTGWTDSDAYDAEAGTWNGYKLAVWEGKCVHDWVDATCTEPKTCNLCGATEGEALGHTEGEAVKENETNTSYDSVVYCTVCGEELSRETVIKANVIASGYCGGEGDGTNLTWELTKDGTLTISGTGAMKAYTSRDDIPWCSYKGSITEVVIENGVTTIAHSAFYDCDSLTAVTIPASVTSIGGYAFYSNDALTNVALGNGVTTVGIYAFGYCERLAKILLPEGLRSIGSLAFYDCDSLTAVTIPASVTSIDGYAFCSNDALTNIAVNTGNANYTDENGVLFNKTKTTLICYPGGRVEESYRVPDGVARTEDSAFANCKNLKNVIFAATFNTFGLNTFEHSANLKKVYFEGSAPEGVLASDSLIDFGTSFYADTTLYYIPGTTGWTDSDAYDAEAGTWNGYKLAVWEEKCAAKIGNVFYGTLTDAIEAAAEGDTITLLADSAEEMTISKELVITKNGFTATGITAGEGYEVIETNTVYEINKIDYTIEPGGGDDGDEKQDITISGGNTDPSGNKSEIEVPVSVIMKVHADNDKRVDLTIKCGTSGITFNSTALEEIINNALDAAQIQLSIEKDKDKKPQNNGAEVFEINLTAKGQTGGIWSGNDNKGLAEVKIHVGKNKNSVKVFYVDENGNSQEIDDARIEDGYVVFTAKHFSTYEIVTTEGVASIDGTTYATLAEAIEAVSENGTIELLADTDETIAVSKALTINRNGFTASGLTTADGVELTETDEAYITVGSAVEPELSGVVTPKSKNCSLEDVVYMNLKLELTEFAETVPTKNVGMLIWHEDTYPGLENATYENAEIVVKGSFIEGNRYVVQTKGIPAPDIDDTVYMLAFVDMGNGNYIYATKNGEKTIVSDSPAAYCRRQLASTTALSVAFHDTAIAALNYGAAAQSYFGKTANGLMNVTLTAEQKTINWDDYADVITTIPAVTAEKAGKFVRSSEITSRTASLNLASGAIDIVYGIGLSATGTVVKKELLVWDEEAFAANDVLSEENAIVLGMKYNSSNSKYEATYKAIPIAEIDRPLYACAHFEMEDGTTYYSDVLAYNPMRYAQIQINKTGLTGQPLQLQYWMKTMIVYFDAASKYFG